MSGPFADAFYYLALLNPKDRSHADATRITRELRQPIVTTTWVLIEVADALVAPSRRRIVHRFLEGLGIQAETRIIPADAKWYGRGLALYGARPDKSWSLTDCIGFEVMREYGLVDALTGDHHFEQAGFRAMFREP